MSHELRTPLNGILGFVQLLQMDPQLTSQQQARLTVMRDSDHLLTLIDDVLDMASIEAGKITLKATNVDLRALFDIVIQSLRPRADAKQLDLQLDLDPRLAGTRRAGRPAPAPGVAQPAGQCHQFTDAGHVRLQVDLVPATVGGTQRLACAVSDTGIGLTAEQSTRLFQPFEQLGDLPRRQGGSGLGLSISQELVRLMGGQIAVESTPAGQPLQFRDRAASRRMSFAIVAKLLAIPTRRPWAWAGRRAGFRLLGEGDPARVLANAAFYLFVPALLVRTTARLDTHALPWSLLAAFFVPVLGLIALVYLWQRPRRRSAAEPSVKAITAGFGNTLQVGIPWRPACLARPGWPSTSPWSACMRWSFADHADAACRAGPGARGKGSSSLAATLLQTARNTVIHPVVLPVVVVLGNVTGWAAGAGRGPADLGTAVVPPCLTRSASRSRRLARGRRAVGWVRIGVGWPAGAKRSQAPPGGAFATLQDAPMRAWPCRRGLRPGGGDLAVGLSLGRGNRPGAPIP